MSDPISVAADSLRGQIQEKVELIKSDAAMAEILKMQAALNGLENLLGRTKTTLAQLFALGEDDGATSASIVPDEFVNLPALDAAKKYLRKVGKPARPFADVVRGVRAGGGVVNHEDKLKIQLVRSNDVKKVGDDLFGLADWYPARKGRPPGDGGSRAATRATVNTEHGEIPEEFDDADADQMDVEAESASPETE